MTDTSFDANGFLIYPDPALDMSDFNFKERSALSPIKLMTQMARSRNRACSFVGHYQLSGSIWSRLNQEFSAMLYSGTLSMAFDISRITANIDIPKVRDMFLAIAINNPYAAMYLATEIANAYIEAHRQQAQFTVDHSTDENSRDANFPSYVMPAHDVFLRQVWWMYFKCLLVLTYVKRIFVILPQDCFQSCFLAFIHMDEVTII